MAEENMFVPSYVWHDTSVSVRQGAMVTWYWGNENYALVCKIDVVVDEGFEGIFFKVVKRIQI